MKSLIVRLAVPLAVALALAACAAPNMGGNSDVASDNARAKVAAVGFLSEPGRLRPAPGGEGFLCWRQADVNWKRFDKIMIERIQVYLTPSSAQSPVDPTDLKTLIDYFHTALDTNLKTQAQMVDAPGQGVLRVRLALTSLTPTNPIKSLAGTAVPYGFVAEMGSGAATGRPAGSTPYMGQTGLQAQFLDGGGGRVLAECADTEIGLKYAAELNKGAASAAEAWANGYASSFTSWTYAQDAFNKWSAAIAKRFGELRAAS